MNLSVAGQTLAIPVYVNPTAGPEQALGGYKLSICLPPPDVRSARRAARSRARSSSTRCSRSQRLHDADGGGLVKWETLFTPYNPGVGTVNRAGTFEARAFVPLPIILGVHVKYKKKKAARTSAVRQGRRRAGSRPAGSLTRLGSPRSAREAATRRSDADRQLDRSPASCKLEEDDLLPDHGSVGERDYTPQGCAEPADAVRPRRLRPATLSPWSAKSVVVKLNK